MIDWFSLLHNEFEKPYYSKLQQFLEEEHRTQVIFPDSDDVFLAFRLSSYNQTKVVILGQDPYHGRGQAHGLSFSVKPPVKSPPSLLNIFKELKSDLGCPIPNHGCLTSWAEQGVLLLNTVLSVREGVPNSHKGKGWETLTDAVISLLNLREQPVVFILWGNPAQQKIKLITSPKHLVLCSVHPSPLASYRGFFGSKPFSQTNQFLIENGSAPINWQL